MDNQRENTPISCEKLIAKLYILLKKHITTFDGFMTPSDYDGFIDKINYVINNGTSAHKMQLYFVLAQIHSQITGRKNEGFYLNFTRHLEDNCPNECAAVDQKLENIPSPNLRRH